MLIQNKLVIIPIQRSFFVVQYTYNFVPGHNVYYQKEREVI